jgi:hypothetical protein
MINPRPNIQQQHPASTLTLKAETLILKAETKIKDTFTAIFSFFKYHL